MKTIEEIVEEIGVKHLVRRCTESDVNLQGHPIEVFTGYECGCGWTTGNGFDVTPHIAMMTLLAVAQETEEFVLARRDDFLVSAALDPAWIAGWHAAVGDVAHRISKHWTEKLT